MRKWHWVLVALCAMIAGCATIDPTWVSLDSAVAVAAQEIESALPERSKVAVLYFSSPSETFSSYVIEELMGYLVRGKKLVVVDRNSLDIIKQEQNFQMSGEVDDSSAQEIGKMLGAQSVVAGSLVNLGGSYRFRVYSLNVETAAREAASASTVLRSSQVTYLLKNKENKQAVKVNQAPQVPAPKPTVTPPEWLNYSPPENALWGIGTAKQSSDTISITAAENRAHVSLAQQLNSVAQSVITDYATDARITGSSRAFSFSDAVNRSILETKFLGARAIKRWKGPDGTWWYLVECEKVDATRLLADIINAQAKNYAEFLSMPGYSYYRVGYYLGNIHKSGPVVDAE
jgi:TolB-like protein